MWFCWCRLYGDNVSTTVKHTACFMDVPQMFGSCISLEVLLATPLRRDWKLRSSRAVQMLKSPAALHPPPEFTGFGVQTAYLATLLTMMHPLTLGCFAHPPGTSVLDAGRLICWRCRAAGITRLGAVSVHRPGGRRQVGIVCIGLVGHGKGRPLGRGAACALWTRSGIRSRGARLI